MIAALFTFILLLELAGFTLFLRRFRSGWLALGLMALLFVANMTLYPLITGALR
jgi:hypothetical protein